MEGWNVVGIRPFSKGEALAYSLLWGKLQQEENMNHYNLSQAIFIVGIMMSILSFAMTVSMLEMFPCKNQYGFDSELKVCVYEKNPIVAYFFSIPNQNGYFLLLAIVSVLWAASIKMMQKLEDMDERYNSIIGLAISYVFSVFVFCFALNDLMTNIDVLHRVMLTLIC